MSKLWGVLISVSIIIAIFFGNSNVVINSIMDSSKSAIENILTLAGMICFWSGIFKIFESTSIIQKLSKVFEKTIGFLFNKNNLSDKSKEYICMNMTANILGLDNAATPLGREAMRRLNNLDNTTTANNTMVKFVVINTACLRIVPTTVALLRQQYGSASPTEILLPAVCTSACALTVGLTATFLLKRFFK